MPHGHRGSSSPAKTMSKSVAQCNGFRVMSKLASPSLARRSSGAPRELLGVWREGGGLGRGGELGVPRASWQQHAWCWCRAVGAATLMLVQAWGSGAGLVQQQVQACGSSRSGAATGLVLLQVWCSSMPGAGPDAAAGLGQQQVWCCSSPGDTAGLLSPSLSLSLCLSPSPLAPRSRWRFRPRSRWRFRLRSRSRSLALSLSRSLDLSLCLSQPQPASPRPLSVGCEGSSQRGLSAGLERLQ